jgi:SAM-dependent methyltransferase
MLHTEPTERFSSRVEHYVRCRPTYPKEVLEVFTQECGLSPNSEIADVASGTGIFTRLLLENGNHVFAVEPNSDMRRAGEEYLAKYPNFTSVDGTAEATTLADGSVSLITAAQAAHWFDRDQALKEFRRILKPGGFVALVWNQRRFGASHFDRDYEQLIVKFGIDYGEVQRRGRASEGDQFFAPCKCGHKVLANYQDLNCEDLQGRLLSSSYLPQSGDSRYAPMLIELRQLFEAHQHGGRVRMNYDTKIYFSNLSSD